MFFLCSHSKHIVLKNGNKAITIFTKIHWSILLQITGYLNLLANTIDNFTHGLSLGGAFLISWRSGLFTTFAILVHEVPHEVGDFAILLKSGFSRWDAAVYQLLTASGGLFGSMAALLFSGAANSIGNSYISVDGMKLHCIWILFITIRCINLIFEWIIV